jgi:hypothetical protein
MATLTALVASSALGCGGEDAQEANGQYVLAFPSVAAAVAVDGLQIFVFDSQQAGVDCQSLIAVRRSGQPLPAASLVFQSPIFSTCDTQRGAPATRFSLGFGPRTVLAVGYSKGNDLLIACNSGTVQDGTEPIYLPFGTESVSAQVPGTTCAQLSAYCEKKCQ